MRLKIKIITLFIAILISSCNKKQTEGETNSNEKQTDKIEVVTLAKATKSWNQKALPNYLEGTPEVTVLKITIPPKVKLKLHKHPVILAGFLLKGELTIVDEYKNSIKFKEGDAIIEVVNTFHYGKNEGNKPTEIIVFYAGNKGVPITIIEDEN